MLIVYKYTSIFLFFFFINSLQKQWALHTFHMALGGHLSIWSLIYLHVNSSGGIFARTLGYIKHVLFYKGSWLWFHLPKKEPTVTSGSIPFVFSNPGLDRGQISSANQKELWHSNVNSIEISPLHRLLPPCGPLFWLENRRGSLEWKDPEGRAANTSTPSFYSLPHRLWTAMYMRCSHFNLSQSESPRLSLLPQRAYLTWWEAGNAAGWTVDLWRQRHGLTHSLSHTHTHIYTLKSRTHSHTHLHGKQQTSYIHTDIPTCTHKHNTQIKVRLT